jgi:uncharacterized protein (TIGR04552 family)
LAIDGVESAHLAEVDIQSTAGPEVSASHASSREKDAIESFGAKRVGHAQFSSKSSTRTRLGTLHVRDGTNACSISRRAHIYRRMIARSARFMAQPTTRVHLQSGALVASEVLWHQLEDAPLELSSPTLQDLRAMRLLLRGESVIDWHRLDIHDLVDAERLFRLNGFDLGDANDRARLEVLYERAIVYVTTVLKLKLGEAVLQQRDAAQLVLWAGGNGVVQRNACLLLKIMHLINHLEARELRTWLPIADSVLFESVEQSMALMFDELRGAGVPVVEFAWSRKTQESQVTKLLAKRESLAAQIFDRLRFRVIVDQTEHLEPTLQVILHRCIPFNFVVPSQTVNSLISVAALDEKIANLSRDAELTNSDASPSNEFSSESYRVLNFVADIPIRIESLLPPGYTMPDDRGRIVFVMSEFQVMDRKTAEENERGSSAHELYKSRQLQRVKERLLRQPSSAKGT